MYAECVPVLLYTPPPPPGNSFAAGSYGSSGSMGCQPFGCFDGLPAVLRRSVSGRIFLDQPLPEPNKPLMHLCKPGA